MVGFLEGAELIVLFVIVLIIPLHFLPTIIGAVRKAPNIAVIALVNVLLGWTIIGWVVALVLALQNRSPMVPISAVGVFSGGVVQAPAGWYPDPRRIARVRYFDGVNWTDYTSP